MVLIRRCAAAALLIPALLGTTATAGQEMDSVSNAPGSNVLEIPESFFLPTTLTIAGAPVQIGGTARIEYDDNIYAQAFDTVDDEKLLIRPRIALLPSSGALQLSALAEGDFRKFRRHGSEDTAGGLIKTATIWTPSATDRVTFLSGWQRITEDRGEPEGLTTRRTGPRQIDTIDANLGYATQGPRFGFSLRGTAATYRYVDIVDRNRDLDNFALVSRASYRLSPLLNGFAEGFGQRRNFTFQRLPGEVDRDSNTYGGRLGLSIDPGGALHGEAAVGVYRFTPRDQRLDGRTGLSMQAALVFTPRARTAVTLDGFIGNVATYRTGAQSREDTRIRLGVQQEVRHNLRWQASAIYRRSRYYGTGVTDDIYGGTFEAEYALNRRAALALVTRYAKRDSTAPLSEFSRLRVGLELRGHY